MKLRIFMSCLAIIALTLVAPGCGGQSGEPVSTTLSGDATSIVSTTADAAPDATTETPTSATTIAVPTTGLTPAAQIFQKMTLRQKAAQVLLLGFDGTTLLPTTEELLEDGPPGGLLLLARNVVDASQLASLTTALQEAAWARGSEVGLLIAVDQEGGSVQRVRTGVPTIPAARELGDSASPVEAAALAAETAAGLLALGVNMNLAPVADVVSDPDSFLYSRTYGGDPTLVADYVEAVTAAFVRSGLINAPKHFPGHGSAPGDTHGEAVVSESSQTEFATIHLVPFKAALAAGAECVMVAHIVANTYDPDRPASLSDKVIESLLREGLGFSGLVIADDLEMVAAAGVQPGGNSSAENGSSPTAGDIGDIAVSALEAGCDLLISTGTLTRQQAMIDAIVAAVESGRLPQERLDEAVLRMLSIKLQHGIVAR